MNYTPGPWELRYDEKGLEIGGGLEQSTGVYSSSGFGLVANVVYKKTNILGDSKVLEKKTFEANAKLVASAPEMADALRKCIDILKYYQHSTSWIEDILEKAIGNV